ncbi:MAG TPA: indole-3-glycerol phosphate synthase TrpC [Gemmatimonadaceae bacterium]|nr:indole-3-glycerol phosphate synthase TrpC [Gemmatimonadaceae bacterium]
MQAFSVWRPPGGVLGRIVGEARGRAAALRGALPALERAADLAPTPPSLAGALRRGRTVAVVAEVKRRSPSKGTINPTLSAPAQARAYVAGGATAISVLTEPASFGGSLEDLLAVVGEVPVPVIKKDFHVDAVQLVEARALGAAAALLIARALGPELPALMARARELRLETIVEVRDEAELEVALAGGADVVGVNVRDLETLELDPGVADRLLPLIPANVVALAESGIRHVGDVSRYADAGADAVLVGSSVSAAADPAAAVAALAGVPRQGRVA